MPLASSFSACYLIFKNEGREEYQRKWESVKIIGMNIINLLNYYHMACVCVFKSFSDFFSWHWV